MEIRDYQREAIESIRRDWLTAKRTLVVMATGTGKTVMFLSLFDELDRAGELGRGLIIAHRRELIYQPRDRMLEHYPQLARQTGVVMANENNVGHRLIIATIQSVMSGDRLAQMLAHGEFSHVVIDECHHATADMYLNLVEKFKDAKILGVTATPLRTDGDGLSKVFQGVSYRLPISAAIRRGALVPFDALGIGLPVSFAGIKQTEDGWEREGMGDILKAENILHLVLDKWREYAGNRQTIAFTASVAQAQATAEFFSAQGVRAAWVSGETPKRERDAILKAYQSGEVQVVANCMVLTEGFDAPETGAVLMIAPTKSDLIYVQRLGRGLRLAEGKTDCRVLDFAPVEERNVVMAGDVLGKPRHVQKAEEQAARQGVLSAFKVDISGEAATIDPHQLIVRVLNLLKKDALAWMVDNHYLTAALGEKATLCIGLPDTARVEKAEAIKRTDAWRPEYGQVLDFVSGYRLYFVNGTVKFVGMFTTLDEAKGRADDVALEAGHADEAGHARRDKNLSSKKSEWRKGDISTKQRKLLFQLGVIAPAGCTRGQAAQMITHHLALKAVRPLEMILERALINGRTI